MTDSGDNVLPTAPEATAALREAERTDLQDALKKAEARKFRHGLWVVLGVSPAALIPLAGLLIEGSLALVVVLLVLVTAVEIVQWFKAYGEVGTLQRALYALDESEVDHEEESAL